MVFAIKFCPPLAEWLSLNLYFSKLVKLVLIEPDWLLHKHSMRFPPRCLSPYLPPGDEAKHLLPSSSVHVLFPPLTKGRISCKASPFRDSSYKTIDRVVRISRIHSLLSFSPPVDLIALPVPLDSRYGGLYLLYGASSLWYCRYKTSKSDLLVWTVWLMLARVMIQNMMNEGKIVPPEVTIKLLQRAMLDSANDKFLIDGFPRDEENRAAFENIASLQFDTCLTKIEPEFVLYLDCPEDELERRILSRNQGRADDNIETLRKRFRVFKESSLPVIKHYDLKGKVRKVDAAKPVDEVFEDVKVIFAPLIAKVMWSCKEDNSVCVLEDIFLDQGPPVLVNLLPLLHSAFDCSLAASSPIP
ncbi:uridylate kinase [Musa troglodytarum]|uniref:adenylate kinase n=1 Tax=Musa troglodytarum TaxID=320322 RepID=A0A9E7IGR6_9LILI|nr:uridylate kinase [Musa troglodytarum]